MSSSPKPKRRCRRKRRATAPLLAGVDDDEVGSASGVLNAMQQLGGALGIAVIGTIFFSVAASSGLIDAFHTTLWIEANVLVVTAGLVALLPLQARRSTHP